MFSCEFCEISKNTFFCRTPLGECFCTLRLSIEQVTWRYLYLLQKFPPVKCFQYTFFLEECINFDLKLGDKICRFGALYRSTSQTQHNFLSFSENFKLSLEKLSPSNPHMFATFGGFNVKLKKLV